MTKKVRDNLYGYIYLSQIEIAVAQHPLVLRLHHIHQNSFTYLTYPSAHSTRYPHSLGTMHVAGELVRHAINNSNNDAIERLISDVNLTLEGEDSLGIEVILRDLTRTESGRSFFQKEQLYKPLYHIYASGDDIINTDALSVLIFYQGIRLAALLHDIGHPPFSHIVEYGLQQALRDKYGGHEKIGLELVQIIEDDLFSERRYPAFECAKIFSRACFYLARHLFSPHPESRLGGVYKTLFSGELDADRLDYVKRDILSTGISSLSYDLGRIFDSVFLRKNSETTLTEFGFSPTCLSSLETFYIARLHLYRWVIYHHDVVRRSMSVQRLITNLLAADGNIIKQPLLLIKNNLISIACDENRRRDYVTFTDSYFMGLLSDIHHEIAPRLDTATECERELHLFTSLVLHRRNDRLVSLWKRPDEYLEFCDRMYPKVDDSIYQFNNSLETAFENKFGRKFGKHIGRSEFSLALESELMKRLLPFGEHRVYAYYIARFRAAPDKEFFLSVKSDESRRISVDQVSPTLSALRAAWMRSPQLMMFYCTNQSTRNIDKLTLLDIYRRATKGAVSELLKQSKKSSKTKK